MSGLGQGGVSTFAGATPGAPYPQYFGIFFGVINNNNDPLKKNRCLLQVPQLFGTAVTTWAVSLTPQQNPPKVGTVITALFIGGDVDYPVYLVTDPQIVVENTDANIKPIGTVAHAGTSTKLAAADHVHGNISTSAADFQPDGTAAPGATSRVADAGHVHPQPSSPIFTNLQVTGTAVVGTLQATTIQPLGTLYTPFGVSLNSVSTPGMNNISGTAQDANLNSNFANIVGALQAAGIWV